MEPLHLYVSVPVAGFRVAQAREYWETYPCPPPSTVYGMLLALAGEPDRLAHQGAEIAIALVSQPSRSVVLRTLWRVKDATAGPGLGNNKRPDFQELLSDVRLSVWLRGGPDERASPCLLERVRIAIEAPRNITRFGGLSLGESTHLVDELRPWRQRDPEMGRILLCDHRGDLSLPVWPDHVGSRGTRWGQFRLKEVPIATQPSEQAWTTIRPPGPIR
ncbi:MAG: type I-MYXAN CRISPR-associated protein Cas5/Cmx5/DevS [Gammaproteobacteria bacterium]